MTADVVTDEMTKGADLTVATEGAGLAMDRSIKLEAVGAIIIQEMIDVKYFLK